MPARLEGHVAVVAGATRGAGRGIAVELGAAGAIVYATGRTTRAARSVMNRPETIEETAELVSAAGGVGIAVQVDHTDPAQVAELFERIRSEQDGRLDVLVNDVWGGDHLTQWGKPFWAHDLDKTLAMQQSVSAHLITSHFGAPLLVARRGGLIVEVTDGNTADYRGNLGYDLVKSSIIRLALAQSEELRSHRVTTVALTPGFLRSEAMLDHFGVTEENWRDAGAKDPHFLASETPHFVGRAVVGLAADPDVLRKSGAALTSWDLAKEYDFDDIDGSRPDWGTYVKQLRKS